MLDRLGDTLPYEPHLAGIIVAAGDRLEPILLPCGELTKFTTFEVGKCLFLELRS